MDELLILILVGLYRLVRFLVVGTYKLLRRAAGRGQPAAAPRAVAGSLAARSAAESLVARPEAGASAARSQAAAPALIEALERLARRAEDEARRAEREAATRELGRTFTALAGRGRQRAAALRRDAGAASLADARRELRDLGLLAEVAAVLAAQRRDGALGPLLGDADALAAALYEPIASFCRARGIYLATDRALAAVDGDKLALLAAEDPTGLAVIVLPEAFARQLGWWPALAHEIGHEVSFSLRGLKAELHRRVGLPRAPGRLPATPRFTSADLDGAVAAWSEELFADAFGTMMLGPTYVATMAWVFQRPPDSWMVRRAAGAGVLVEEHPPAHVRIGAACRLLHRMGYGHESGRLWGAWCAGHGGASGIIFPTQSGIFAAVDEEAVIARAAQVSVAAYAEGFDVLLGMPLSSLPGLDFGPREHQAAVAAAAELAAGRRPRLTDPRLIIAGAAAAWLDAPARAAEIYRAARDLIVGVGERRRRGDEAAPQDGARGDEWLGPRQVAEALLLDAVLTRRPWS